MSHLYSSFHIHGDNIVECERTLRLVELALGISCWPPPVPTALAVCPSFLFSLRATAEPWKFTFFPGFGRWKEDILQLVRNRGGSLREAADAIITGVMSDREEPLLAIEYCGVLPAGNQAWQRNGRAGIPFDALDSLIYVAEIGGYELDLQRTRKASRLPNPAVLGENDVDTVLHTVLSRLGAAEVFEGMCNPPGGDWSGISLQSIRRDREFRWLSLPRVSKTHAKRPDHVFQILALDGPPVILAVESKERFRDVETRIGPRLKAYISDLLASPASVERRSSQEIWRTQRRVLTSTILPSCRPLPFWLTTSRILKSCEERAMLISYRPSILPPMRRMRRPVVFHARGSATRSLNISVRCPRKFGISVRGGQ